MNNDEESLLGNLISRCLIADPPFEEWTDEMRNQAAIDTRDAGFVAVDTLRLLDRAAVGNVIQSLRAVEHAYDLTRSEFVALLFERGYRPMLIRGLLVMWPE